MKSRTLGLIAALALTLVSGVASAIEFRSVTEPSILYDTPSDKGRKLSIILTGTPVEVVVELDKWLKVRDPAGALSWIDRRAVSTERTVLVTSASATVRQQASDTSPAVFTTVRDAVLQLNGSAENGWVRIRHADGTQGFLRVSEVWGL